eukprot:gene23552-9076_t
MAVPGDKNYDPNVWQDREIRFDTKPADLDLRAGEALLEVMDPVEDTKGNNGEQGDFRVTNIRLVWISKKNHRTNISIGLGCVTALSIKEASSRLKGETQAIYVLTKHHNQRFEFIFTTLAKDVGQLLYTVQTVFKSFDGTRLYRNLKLRGAIIRDRELVLLPLEETYSRVNGVMNLSSEQATLGPSLSAMHVLLRTPKNGNLGTFFISNLRVVWYANLAENFNVSIPYMQDLLERHPRAAHKKGPGVACIYVDLPPPAGRFKSGPKKCFWVERVDGSTTDFSYVKVGTCTATVPRCFWVGRVDGSTTDFSYVKVGTCTASVPPCFWVERVDGSTTDFSYVKCLKHVKEEAATIHQHQATRDSASTLTTQQTGTHDHQHQANSESASTLRTQQTGAHEHQHQATAKDPRSEGIYAHQEVFRAMRDSILPQIDRFKRYTFGSAKVQVVCPATGQYLSPHTCKVAYVLPNSFQSLSHGFLASLEPNLQLMAYQLHSLDNSKPSLQPLIAQKWKRYHADHAQLRLLSKNGRRFPSLPDPSARFAVAGVAACPIETLAAAAGTEEERAREPEPEPEVARSGPGPRKFEARPGQCNCPGVSWIWAESEGGTSYSGTFNSGKWMLFRETGSKVIETWRDVERLLATGLLGNVGDYRDIADCFRVLLALRDGVPGCEDDLINYKTDDATLAGIYSESSQRAGGHSASKKPHRNFKVSRYTSPKILTPSTSVEMLQNNLGPNYERRLVAERTESGALRVYGTKADEEDEEEAGWMDARDPAVTRGAGQMDKASHELEKLSLPDHPASTSSAGEVRSDAGEVHSDAGDVRSDAGEVRSDRTQEPFPDSPGTSGGILLE